jgi:hypothetical protein
MRAITAAVYRRMVVRYGIFFWLELNGVTH